MSDAIWQLLYPKYGGEFGVLDLTDVITIEQGRGIPPLHYSTQRGTYQHGETPVNLRLDPRIIQIGMADERQSRPQLYEDLARLLSRVNPGRNWAVNGALTKCIYRKIMPGGRKHWRSDLVTSSSKVVTSATGRFAEWGLGPGHPFTISSGADAGDYVVEAVTNENTLTLTTALSSTATGVQYRVVTGLVSRDLYVLLESGPVLEDDRQEDTLALGDTIKLVAHDPVWRNPMSQTVSWGVTDLSNLIFWENPNYTNRAVFPIWFGSDSILADSSLTYLGTWPSRPTVVINGPLTGVDLENMSTGDKLVMTYSAVEGEQITINLEALTVVNNYGQNLMRYMSTPFAAADSDLITFGLYPDPQVSGGVNHINLTISGAVLGHTSATMNWYSRYIGV